MRSDAWRRTDELVADVHRDLIAERIVAPLQLGGDDEQHWSDHDLASMVEHRIGDRTDPRQLDDARRVAWRERATTEEPWPPSRRNHERCYWLLHNGQRVGTIALATSTLGSKLLHVASLYVVPDRRRQGLARHALTRLRDGLGQRGLGLRLDTSWCWQPTVALYMRMGMWVRMWKRELTLWWDERTPARSLEIDDRRARLSVQHEGRSIVLMEAVRDGDRLRLEIDRVQTLERSVADLRWDAMSTLALGLALHGWPLVRSTAEWERCRGSDAGAPEALASKIEIWEAWSRKHGWLVDTPRIPGLAYPSWDDLERRWNREGELATRGER